LNNYFLVEKELNIFRLLFFNKVTDKVRFTQLNKSKKEKTALKKEYFTLKKPNYFNFLFDGSNFRGYFSESELIAKAYANNWAAAITTKVFAEENESYLLNKADLIRTESYDENIKLYIEEGQNWLRRKYGFNSRWSMQQYTKSFYDSFFDFYPEYKKFKA